MQSWKCSDNVDFLSPFRSLAVGHQYSSLGTQPILCGSIPGLVPKQLRFCRNYVEIMPSVAEGVKIGIQECQHQFRGRRWNCTTVNDNLAIFGPVLDKGNVTKQTVNCNKMSRLCTSLFFVQIRVYLNTQHSFLVFPLCTFSGVYLTHLWLAKVKSCQPNSPFPKRFTSF